MLKFAPSASVLHIIADEPNGITISELTKILYPEAVGTSQFKDAVKIAGSKLADCVRDNLAEPIGFKQGKTLFSVTELGAAIAVRHRRAGWDL